MCTLFEGKEFDEYEKNTGLLIVDMFKDKDYEAVPAVLLQKPWTICMAKMSTKQHT